MSGCRGGQRRHPSRTTSEGLNRGEAALTAVASPRPRRTRAAAVKSTSACSASTSRNVIAASPPAASTAAGVMLAGFVLTALSHGVISRLW